MQFVGYRIVVEPEITEPVRGRLVTRALLWKFRAVFENSRTGDRVQVLTNLRGAADSRVLVRRPFESSDYRRRSRLFKSERKALRRYSGLRNSQDITLLSPPPVNPPVAQPAPQPLPPPPPPPTCREVLLKKGHNAMHLKKCKGADRACAVALLRAGHSPIHLDRCRKPDLTLACVRTMMRKKISPIHLDRCQRVDPHCAVSLLESGNSQIHLDKCRTPGLSRRCVTALFRHKHSAIHVNKCKGVDGRCAELLLAKQSPIHLQNCR